MQEQDNTKGQIRLVQLMHPRLGRKLALVQEPHLVLLDNVTSVYELALDVINNTKNLKAVIEASISQTNIEYDLVYYQQSEWTILPSFDCPENPFKCLVSGTGLTHKNSALNRQVMHQSETGSLTDSMKMYQLGLEGGRPQDGKIGTQPEWFYKGTGAVLKGHGQVLSVPVYANDGGEEPEIAGAYIVNKAGRPFRIGFTTANEFSDHVMERKNYLYLAPSKLRSCSIGPELVVDMDFLELEGEVSVLRKGEKLWSSVIHTGEKNMSYSLANLEYHHFKYADHRQPFQAHVHFYGADAFSFGAGVQLETGDEMQVQWKGMGRPLINSIEIDKEGENYVAVTAIG